jgi:ribonuclease-3
MNSLDTLRLIFKDEALLDLALTHKSWLNEHPEAQQSNERLEFLGDAILEFIISKEIYARFPNEEEGFLTTLRANLVNTNNLAQLAIKLDVGTYLKMAKGEEETGGRANNSLLADTIEAIIGALFLDQGLDAVYEFIKANLITEIPQKVSQPLKDPKSRLQEYVQAQKLPTPKYKVVEESGPDHNKKFVVEVIIDNQSQGRGEGKNKNIAEQEAAKAALEKLL